MEHTENQSQGMPVSEIQSLRDELRELKALAVENQRMIKSVYKRMRFSSAFSIIKWVFIIAVTLGAFYYVQPVFEAVLKTYESVGGLGSGPNGQSVLELFKSL